MIMLADPFRRKIDFLLAGLRAKAEPQGAIGSFHTNATGL